MKIPFGTIVVERQELLQTAHFNINDMNSDITKMLVVDYDDLDLVVCAWKENENIRENIFHIEDLIVLVKPRIAS